MSRVKRNRQRGDTIVEVMFAVAVFAMLAVGAISIMNQGTLVAQRSLEITLVRQQIDSQAESLRYLHKSYVASYGKTSPGNLPADAAEWDKLRSGFLADAASNFGELSGDRCPGTAPGSKPFVMNARTARRYTGSLKMEPSPNSSLPPFPQVAYNADNSINDVYGLWIEAVQSRPGEPTGFIDFHIRACWDSPGSSVPVTLGTIVRLYEPR